MPHDGQRRQAVGVQLGGAEHDAQVARKTADHRSLRDAGNLLNIVLHFVRDGAQLIAAIVRSPQGQSQDGNIVDGARLDDGLRNSGRHLAEVGIELAVHLDERVFLRRAHQKAHDHQALAGAGDRVHVLDARNLMDQPFDGKSDTLLDLGRRCARHGGGNVQHGHENLRIFLARNHRHGKDSQRQRRGNEERRQLRVEKGVRQPAGHSHGLLHGWLPVGISAIRLPARSRSKGSSTSFSPPAMPDKTSTKLPCTAPRVR